MSAHPYDALSVLRMAFGALLIASLCVAGVISFAAIVYSGPLTPFVGTGIGLALLGAAVMSAIGGFFYSHRGTVCIPQDITAIVLAVTTTGVAASWPAESAASLLPTIVAMVAVATVTAGVTTYVFGYFRLGFLARFLPYPVMGGFLAATGYLLLIGGIGMCIGDSFDFHRPWGLFEEGAVYLWLPWVTVAVTAVAASQWMKSDLLLPGLLAAATAGFYLVLHLIGMDLVEAEAAGLLLGPFQGSSFIDVLDPSLIRDADWTVVLGQAPIFLAVAGLTIIGTLLHATGLELAMDAEVDLERDLRATGIANVAGGLAGGLIGFQVMGGTTLGQKLRLSGILPGLSAAAGCAITFLFGGTLLSALPVGLFAALIILVGIDLLVTWLWLKRRQLSLPDYCLVLLILFTTATLGLFPALAVGVLAATAFFITSFARVEVVRLRSTAASRHSLTERSDTDLERLMQAGKDTAILELSGYLFFGTANTLFKKLRAELRLPGRPKTLIVDFARVTSLDASVAYSLGKLSRVCQRLGVGLIFCGLSDPLREIYLQGASDLNTATLMPSLDAALQEQEVALLSSHSDRPEDDKKPGTDAASRPAFFDGLERVSVPKGGVLIRQGDASTEMFFLLSGEMHAEIEVPDHPPVAVARFVAGAPIGEIAFYTAVPRTATVIADTQSELLKVSARDIDPASGTSAYVIHQYVAQSLARRLRSMTLLLRDAEL
jgi:SulP family sulfate permease